MRVVFQKGKRGLCTWTAYPPKRRPVSAVSGGVGRGLIPHDLAQLVIERELGHTFGFWGSLAAGASFRSLVRGGRKRTRPGVAVLREHLREIDEAEHAFHRHLGHWLRGEDTPARAGLDDALHAWRSIAENEHFEVEFPIDNSRRRSRLSGV